MPRKPTQLREKLIQTGLDYIEQYGVETISLRLIAEKCQVSHGSPYKYFKNKQDYLETVLAEIRAIFAEVLLQDITETASDRQRLLQMGTNFVAFATCHPHYFNALFLDSTLVPVSLADLESDKSAHPPALSYFQKAIAALNHEAKRETQQVLIHLWSYITGLALLVSRADLMDISQAQIEHNIAQMISIYFGEGD